MSDENARHYRDMAEKVRRNAEDIHDLSLKVQYLELALSYDRLATSMERFAISDGECETPESGNLVLKSSGDGVS